MGKFEGGINAPSARSSPEGGPKAGGSLNRTCGQGLTRVYLGRLKRGDKNESTSVERGTVFIENVPTTGKGRVCPVSGLSSCVGESWWAKGPENEGSDADFRGGG